jgi:hypothetical protein
MSPFISQIISSLYISSPDPPQLTPFTFAIDSSLSYETYISVLNHFTFGPFLFCIENNCCSSYFTLNNVPRLFEAPYGIASPYTHLTQIRTALPSYPIQFSSVQFKFMYSSLYKRYAHDPFHHDINPIPISNPIHLFLSLPPPQPNPTSNQVTIKIKSYMHRGNELTERKDSKMQRTISLKTTNADANKEKTNRSVGPVRFIHLVSYMPNNPSIAYSHILS